MTQFLKYNFYCLVILSLLTVQTFAQNYIPITLDKGDKTTISTFSPDGVIDSSFDIIQKEKNSFLSGNFGSTLANIAVLSIDTNVTFKIHNLESAVAISIDLGKKKLIKSIAAKDLDQDGLDDLIVFNKQGVLSYYPASSNFQQKIDFGRVKRGKSYFIITKNNAPYLLASVKQRRKRGKIFLSNLNGALVAKTKIPRGTKSIIPIDQGVENEPILAFEKKKKLILSKLTGGKVGVLRIQKDTQIIAQDALNLGYDQIVIVKADQMQILDPINKVSIQEASLNFNETEDPSISSSCDEFQNLMSQAIALMMMGREGEANALLNNLQDYMECFDGAFNGGGVYQPTSEDTPQLISDHFHLFGGGSSAGTGPCDRFMNPNDGSGGFLAKNGDHDGRIVVLTPGGHYYQEADILNLRYKKMESLNNTGWGNPDYAGLRMHFRGGRSVQSYGQFIVAAHGSSGTTCWKVTRPSSRID